MSWEIHICVHYWKILGIYKDTRKKTEMSAKYSTGQIFTLLLIDTFARRDRQSQGSYCRVAVWWPASPSENNWAYTYTTQTRMVTPLQWWQKGRRNNKENGFLQKAFAYAFPTTGQQLQLTNNKDTNTTIEIQGPNVCSLTTDKCARSLSWYDTRAMCSRTPRFIICTSYAHRLGAETEAAYFNYSETHFQLSTRTS